MFIDDLADDDLMMIDDLVDLKKDQAASIVEKVLILSQLTAAVS